MRNPIRKRYIMKKSSLKNLAQNCCRIGLTDLKNRESNKFLTRQMY